MTVLFIQGNLRDFFYMINPFDDEGKERVLIDEDLFISFNLEKGIFEDNKKGG